MSYPLQLAGWALLQAAWQTLLLGVVLMLMLRLMRGASAELRYRCAVLHLAAAIGAIVLTLVVSHASVAAGAGLAPVSKARSGWSPGPEQFLGMLAWSWLGGIVIAQALLVVRLIHLVRLVRSAVPAAPEIKAAVEEMSLAIGLSRPPRVCCADVASPMVSGWRSSFIVVPRRFSEIYPRAEARALLAHELAHVLRRDYSRNIVQLLAAFALWWHPAVWFIYARIRHERECSSDERAVRLAGSAAGLANGLLRLAAASVGAGVVPIAADSSRLSDRISRLSAPPARPATGLIPLVFWSALASFTAIVAGASATAGRQEILTREYATSALSPRTVITIQAQDPAGPFLVQMVRGRVVGVVLGREPVSADCVIQRGNMVRVLGQTGQELLRLDVDPRGGFRWKPRRAA